MNDVDKIVCAAGWVLKNAIVKIKELNYNAGKINLAGLQPNLRHYGCNIKVLLWGRIEV